MSADKKFTWSLQGLYLNLNYNTSPSDNAVETGNQITALKEKVQLPGSPKASEDLGRDANWKAVTRQFVWAAAAGKMRGPYC